MCEFENLDTLENLEELNDEIVDEKLTKPFLKWAGGKLRVVNKLKKYMPKQPKRFVEPFLGAGSVALNIDCKDLIVADSNLDLISVWRFLKEHKGDFVQECKKLFVPENNMRDSFDALKTEFNTSDDKFRKATLFIYLNRHCFNGLCRYNGSGIFNVPFGKYPKPYFPEAELNICVDKVQNFRIHHKDFRYIFDMAEPGDVFYCDPPYLPLSQSSNFDSYAVGGFGLKEQLDLAELAAAAAKKGATVVISNHYNWYSKELYKEMYGARIYKTSVSRTISSKTDNRKAVEEIIAIFGQ
jgi:DNA adenine methylase